MLVRTRQISWQSDLINLQLEPLQNYLLLTSTPCLLRTHYSSKSLNLAIGNWILLLSFVAFPKLVCSGAGYPSSYYPYIIATLVDTVPQECGGTGGQVSLMET